MLSSDLKLYSEPDTQHAKTVLQQDCSTFLLHGVSRSFANYAGSIAYPNNALRNVARLYAPTQYVTVLDVDITPSKGMAKAFWQALNSLNPDQRDTTAFVLPAFEARHDALDKVVSRVDMLNALERHDAQPFYKDLCSKCQRTTGYDKWVLGPRDDTDTTSYEVAWEDPWEPFFIVSNTDCPLYDERFKQYGFNRISQVCETHIAGFQFRVLYNAFVVHDGFKVKTGFHSSKQAEQERNRALFRLFKQELKLRYPDTARRCY
eukprot:m.371914 g.371914  ORF g.371914 m.371914 type:complete len:262 (-) comp60505_c0_seq1:100-885(-)